MHINSITTPANSNSIQPPALPDRRSSWPESAVSEFWDVLGELNAWSREYGEPIVNNAWIAETAIRQTW